MILQEIACAGPENVRMVFQMANHYFDPIWRQLHIVIHKADKLSLRLRQT
jgi:hypothetical protein